MHENLSRAAYTTLEGMYCAGNHVLCARSTVLVLPSGTTGCTFKVYFDLMKFIVLLQIVVPTHQMYRTRTQWISQCQLLFLVFVRYAVREGLCREWLEEVRKPFITHDFPRCFGAHRRPISKGTISWKGHSPLLPNSFLPCFGDPLPENTHSVFCCAGNI